MKTDVVCARKDCRWVNEKLFTIMKISMCKRDAIELDENGRCLCYLKIIK